MKDTLIDMMVAMMPLMKPFMWLGVVVAAIGIILIVTNFALKSNMQKAVTWSARIVLGVSIFFIIAQVMGYFLSMPPTINFGDSSKFEFILVSFWQIGAGFLVVSFIIKFLSGDKNAVAL
ncbi:hypothetical protein MNBD_GAMMA07-571 [hydrothermal vent metagenome]|uniref:Uncharacterized protein n=1 Tax=hydrothermal vent metagenome TaxID=652676 RepID=A0A3B0WYP5_9ZZZZ